MAKLLSTIIDGFIASKNFVSGALGSGWRIAKKFGRWVLEIDDIVVRGRMTVFELLIQKIRAVKGALGITQASGKIKEIREDANNYYLQIEDEMSFVANDIVRCLEFNSSQRSYWVIVSGVENNEIVIPKTEFEGSSVPLPGDEIIQFGNTTDVTRQSAIYLHADEGGEPAIDVLFGINSKSFDGCTKIRVGGDIPGEPGYKGFFCENGLIKSVNTAGEIMYLLRPDGSGFMAKGNISWNADGSGSIFNKAIYWDMDGFHFGNGIKLTWDNLDDDAKENLKGESGVKGDPGDQGNPGQDANLLPWVEEWNNANKTQIGGVYVVSPKMFSGTKDEVTEELTGVAFGRGVVTVLENGVEMHKTGIFGLKDGKITFSIDEDGNAFYSGEINVNDKFRVNPQGQMECIDAYVKGKIATPFVSSSSDLWGRIIQDNYCIYDRVASALDLSIELPIGKQFNGVVVRVFNFDPLEGGLSVVPFSVSVPEMGFYPNPYNNLLFHLVRIIDLQGQKVESVSIPPLKMATFIGVGDPDYMGGHLFCWKLLSIS